VSTIWTPGGEYVPKQEPAQQRPPAQAPPPTAGPRREASPEEVEAALAQARQEILSTPVLDHVAGHAMGLFELAVLHLEEERPQLEEARLAIDAMAALVEGLGDRLGKYQVTLSQALAQLRLAFVQATGG
jgi:hypothetical protein